MSNNVGSINDSRINVKKCASRNGLKLRSANTTRSMRCNTAVQDRGRRLNQSQFRSMAEFSFLPSANTRKRASASREDLRLNSFKNKSRCILQRATDVAVVKLFTKFYIARESNDRRTFDWMNSIKFKASLFQTLDDQTLNEYINASVIIMILPIENIRCLINR